MTLLRDDTPAPPSGAEARVNADVGVVAIGRNEGERLGRCLRSVAGRVAAAVYVDSDSTDDSVGLARALGAEVVSLDMSRPFTAARARNAGFERLTEVAPGVEFVQFLDGDCEVIGDWLDAGSGALRRRSDAAVVFGRLLERHPDRSVYNRVAQVEWNIIGPRGGGGEVETCGGNAMLRARALRDVRGYEPSVPAGEEPELCQRLRRAGWSVLFLDEDMAWHDTAMLRFGQWARRQVRTGYGGLDFSARFGSQGDDPFRSQIRSARVWGVAWPLAALAATGLAGAVGGTSAAAAAAAVSLLAPAAQAARIARKNRGRAGGARTALAYGALTVLGKPFQAVGQAMNARDRLTGRHARLIEYKAPAASQGGTTDPALDPEGAARA